MSERIDTLDEDQEFIAPDNGGWHYTIMRDWIAVCPDIGPTATRLYWIIRSIMHEKGERARRLSYDQLCYLLPGVNGKPTGETRVKDALRELEGVGLLSNPDGDVVRRWITDPKTGKQRKDNFRRWKIHDYPTPDYAGWRSAIAKLDAYTEDWRERLSTEGRNSDPQSPSKTVPSNNAPSSQRSTEGRNSDSSRRNSDPPRRNSGGSKPVPSNNAATKNPSKESLQLTSARARAGAGWLEGQQDNEGEDATSSPGKDSQPCGSSETSSDPDGARLLRSLPRGVGQTLTSSAVSEWSHVIGEALHSGMSEQVITDKLTSGLPDDDRAKRVRIVVGRRLPDLQATIAEPVQRQQSSPSQEAHAQVDRMAGRGEHGAREAAGLLGEFWDPEQHRGEAGSREWKLQILPELSREFVEQRREALVKVLTSRNAA